MELFNEDEANAVLNLSPMAPESPAQVAERTGGDPERMARLLDGMADKGLIYSSARDGENWYKTLQLVPGIFELQFMKGDVDDRTKKLAGLFDEMYHSGWGEEIFASKTQMARVIVMEKEVPSGVEVFPYEKVSKFIEETDFLAQTVCYCRHEKELLGKSCGKSKDVCLQFGPMARFVVERGFGREIDKAERPKRLF